MKSETRELQWIPSLDLASVKSRQEGKPIMLDLFADWCLACKELDATVFSNPAIVPVLAGGFVLARVDFTTESPENLALTDTYSVAGLPTVLFLNSDASEIPGTRVTGVLGVPEFDALLQKVKSDLKKVR